MSKFSLTLCSTLLLAGLTLPAWANPSDISGMTTFGPKALITVSDCKTKSEKPRLHILNVQPDKGPKYLPITVPVWQKLPGVFTPSRADTGRVAAGEPSSWKSPTIR